MDIFKYMLVGLLAVMYVLIMVFRKHKSLIAFLAAVVFIVLGIVFPERVFPLPEDVVASNDFWRIRLYPLIFLVTESVDWNVVMMYLGCLILSAVVSYSGFPAACADFMASRTRSPALAVALVLGFTGILSVFAGNMAVFMMMSGVALAVASRMKISPVCFVVGTAFMSNLGSAGFISGESASMIFAGLTGFGPVDFFLHGGRPSLFFAVMSSVLAGCLFFLLVYSRTGKTDPVSPEKKRFSVFPSVLMVLMIAGLVVIDCMNLRIDFLPGLFVLGLAMLSVFWFRMIKRNSKEKMDVLLETSGLGSVPYLVFVFLIIGILSHSGVLVYLGDFLMNFSLEPKIVVFAVLAAFSMLLSVFIDNNACLVALLPVVAKFADAASMNGHLLPASVLVGTCLGCNLLPLGAGVNMAAMNILEQHGYKVKLTGWLKMSLPFTVMTVAAAAFVVMAELR